MIRVEGRLSERRVWVRTRVSKQARPAFGGRGPCGIRFRLCCDNLVIDLGLLGVLSSTQQGRLIWLRDNMADTAMHRLILAAFDVSMLLAAGARMATSLFDLLKLGIEAYPRLLE